MTTGAETYPDEPLAPEIIGKVALINVPIEFWWTTGDTYDLPTYGAEMLGPDF